MGLKQTFKNFFRPSSRYTYVTTPDGEVKIELTSYNFADAIYLAILKKLLEGLQNTEYSLVNKKPDLEQQRLFNSFLHIFENNIESVLIRYLENGVVYFKRDAGENILKLTNQKNEATYSIKSTCYKLNGLSDKSILSEDFEHIDNILNAVSTSVKKLGALIMMTPKPVNEIPPSLGDDEIKEFEKDLANDYGMLSSQSNVKIMRRAFDVKPISLVGANLRTNENLQTAVKIVCDVLEVPYEIVAAAIVGNPNQTGVYQTAAVERLYQTIEKYVKIFVKFAERELNLKLEYNILTAPQAEKKTEWEAKEKVLDTLIKAVEKGYMSDQQAKEQFNIHFNL